MNYFEFYQFRPQVLLDLNVLRQKYYDKSRELHPDQNITLNLSKENFEYDSAYNNNAYKTLSSFELRLKYILELEYINLESQHNKLLSEDFLNEMLELHEEIIEAKSLNQKEKLTILENSIRHIEEENLHEMKPHFSNYDCGTKEANTLHELQQFYYKLKYFNRIKTAIKGIEVEL